MAGAKPEVARSVFLDIASQLNLDVERFTRELDGGVYTALVQQQGQEAMDLNLPGTPSAIVDGYLLPDVPFDYTVWQQYVEQKVQTAQVMAELADRQYDAPPPMQIDTDKRYFAHVMMATGTTFTLELYPKSAPLTVNSFVFLAQEGWFDGVTFHRVLPGFVAQTGDPSGTGLGGPGYTIVNEIDPALSHKTAGMVSMANSGPDTNGSQWFITLGDASHLDGSYTLFGQVIDGMDVVNGLTPRDPDSGSGLPPGDVIQTITIEVKE